jgi:hypothetical protein
VSLHVNVHHTVGPGPPRKGADNEDVDKQLSHLNDDVHRAGEEVEHRAASQLHDPDHREARIR